MLTRAKIGRHVIRECRVNLKLTQQEAGALIGRSRRCWQEWEGGRRNMSAELWELFCMKIKQKAEAYMDEPVTERKRAAVARKHQKGVRK